ncbi:MAG TPA: ribonuclease H-like domain-containing protein [Candidatus Saccharimonadales bacterium]|nr:ribonuclease H-like domain-containing protein [Candidatus Saccharimonadales bacterium]
MNLFFDIETIPAQDEQQAILKEIHAKKLADGKKVSEKFEEYLTATSFDGAFGSIICIGYAIDDDEVEVLYGEEKQILKDFWAIAKSQRKFIGFNNMDFDLRFIYQRSVIQGVSPTQNLSFARYRNDPIYDIMWEWRKWAREPSVSLDTLAKALGIPSSKGGEIEGKNVWQAYKDGKLAQICEYCKKDVEVTRAIYKKMVFAEQVKLEI